MKIKQEYCDLFKYQNSHYLVHCISSDFKLGAGIAVEFNKRYSMRQKLFSTNQISKYPNCILVDNVFNLVTKELYYLKPSYCSLQRSLDLMKNIVVENNIKLLAMPKIGCGLDRLQWDKVKFMIEETFADLDVEIIICIK